MLGIAPFSYLEFEVQKYKESIKKRKNEKKKNCGEGKVLHLHVSKA